MGLLRYFHRSLPVARARVNATMGIEGAFWPETSTLFGTYEAAGLGYGCDSINATRSPFNDKKIDRQDAGPTVPAVNGEFEPFRRAASLWLALAFDRD